MIKYRAVIFLDGELQTIEYETSGNSIEYLWSRYGMDTFIESLDILEDKEDQ